MRPAALFGALSRFVGRILFGLFAATLAVFFSFLATFVTVPGLMLIGEAYPVSDPAQLPILIRVAGGGGGVALAMLVATVSLLLFGLDLTRRGQVVMLQVLWPLLGLYLGVVVAAVLSWALLQMGVRPTDSRSAFLLTLLLILLPFVTATAFSVASTYLSSQPADKL